MCYTHKNERLFWTDATYVPECSVYYIRIASITLGAYTDSIDDCPRCQRWFSQRSTQDLGSIRNLIAAGSDPMCYVECIDSASREREGGREESRLSVKLPLSVCILSLPRKQNSGMDFSLIHRMKSQLLISLSALDPSDVLRFARWFDQSRGFFPLPEIESLADLTYLNSLPVVHLSQDLQVLDHLVVESVEAAHHLGEGAGDAGHVVAEQVQLGVLP